MTFGHRDEFLIKKIKAESLKSELNICPLEKQRESTCDFCLKTKGKKKDVSSLK